MFARLHVVFEAQRSESERGWKTGNVLQFMFSSKEIRWINVNHKGLMDEHEIFIFCFVTFCNLSWCIGTVSNSVRRVLSLVPIASTYRRVMTHSYNCLPEIKLTLMGIFRVSKALCWVVFCGVFVSLRFPTHVLHFHSAVKIRAYWNKLIDWGVKLVGLSAFAINFLKWKLHRALWELKLIKFSSPSNLKK